MYTIFSVRIALIFLGKEQFGLWALALQVSGYMSIMDLGMTSALSRFIADHKDDVNGGQYGAMLLTGGLSFICQGIIIAILGCIFAFYSTQIFSIPKIFETDFRNVLTILMLVTGISVALRGVGAPIWAFQRLDINNVISALVLITSFLMLWVGFKAGWGIYSLAYAGIPGTIISPLLVSIICYRSGYYPRKGNWNKPQWTLFIKILGFGKDVLLLSVGSQMVNATQVIILSKFVGLDAAASFSICTKFYNMGQQFVGKILESAAPVLTEIFVQGDLSRFTERFWNIVAITSFIATIGGAAIVTQNQLLVSLWTSGVIKWSLMLDALLATLLVITSISRCFTGIFGIIGNISPIRYIYFIEGILFILLAIPAARYYGVIGLLLTSVLVHITTTLLFSIKISSKIINSMKVRKQIANSLIIIAFTTLATLVISKLISKSGTCILFSVCIIILASISSWRVLLTQKNDSRII